MIKESHTWSSFAAELERIEILQICFPIFNIIQVPRARNQISNFLAKTAKSFHRELHFWLFYSGLVIQTTSSLRNRIFDVKKKQKQKVRKPQI